MSLVNVLLTIYVGPELLTMSSGRPQPLVESTRGCILALTKVKIFVNHVQGFQWLQWRFALCSGCRRFCSLGEAHASRFTASKADRFERGHIPRVSPRSIPSSAAIARYVAPGKVQCPAGRARMVSRVMQWEFPKITTKSRSRASAKPATDSALIANLSAGIEALSAKLETALGTIEALKATQVASAQNGGPNAAGYGLDLIVRFVAKGPILPKRNGRNPYAVYAANSGKTVREVLLAGAGQWAGRDQVVMADFAWDSSFQAKRYSHPAPVIAIEAAKPTVA